jgi:glyoxylase-like metal-dependent hydrolase (beta-lactamase superfamily II)
MFASLQRVKALPPETVILPGHHYQPECATELRRELEASPPFRCGSVEELRALP